LLQLTIPAVDRHRVFLSDFSAYGHIARITINLKLVQIEASKRVNAPRPELEEYLRLAEEDIRKVEQKSVSIVQAYKNRGLIKSFRADLTEDPQLKAQLLIEERAEYAEAEDARNTSNEQMGDVLNNLADSYIREALWREGIGQDDLVPDLFEKAEVAIIRAINRHRTGAYLITWSQVRLKLTRISTQNDKCDEIIDSLREATHVFQFSEFNDMSVDELLLEMPEFGELEQICKEEKGIGRKELKDALRLR